VSFFGRVVDGDDGDELDAQGAEHAPQLVPYQPPHAPPVVTFQHPNPMRAAMSDELGRGVVRGFFAVGPGLIVAGVGAFLVYRIAKGVRAWLDKRGIRIVKLTEEERARARAARAARREPGPLPASRRFQDVELEDLEREELEDLERERAKGRPVVEEPANIAGGTARERAQRDPFGVSVNVLTALFTDQPKPQPRRRRRRTA